jgi:LPS sulfotransferase NodH
VTQSDSEPPDVFVVGMPRSGTTLLTSILAAHPKVAVAPESHYFPEVWRRFQRPTREDVPRLLEAFFANPHVRAYEFTQPDRDAIRDAVTSDPDRAHAALLGTATRVWARRHDRPVVVEKTPRHLEYLPAIIRLFPDSRFVVMQRDPRDVALSLSRVEWNDVDFITGLRRWRDYARRGRAFVHAHPDRAIRVRFEDLVADTEAQAKRLCDLVGLEYSQAMRRPAPDAAGFDPEHEPWKRRAAAPVDPSRANRWKTRLSSIDQAVADRVLGGELEAQGYERSGAPWSLGATIRLVASTLRPHPETLRAPRHHRRLRRLVLQLWQSYDLQ